MSDERYAETANRGKRAFVVSVAAVSLVHGKPWMLIFAPTEFLLAGESKFDNLCTTCASFAWVAYALGETTYGLAFVLMALEMAADRARETWASPPSDADRPKALAHVLSSVLPYLIVWPVWYCCPWLWLIPMAVCVPLFERKWMHCALRLPLVVVALT